MKKVLITGASGFLGSHLLKTLLKSREYYILALKREQSNVSRIQKLVPDYKENSFLKFVNINEIDDIKSIDIIIHTATNYGRDLKLSEILDTNLILPLKLLEHFVSKGLKLFINTDSCFTKPSYACSAYLGEYIISKKLLVSALNSLSFDVKIANMQLEHPYGEFDGENKFSEKMIQDIAIKKVDCIDLTYGEQKRDFIYIDDVCEAYMTILQNYQEHFFKFMNFEVGTGIAISIRDFLCEIKNYSNSKTELKFGTLEYREDEKMLSKADTNTLKEWGWNFKYSYKEGIKKVIDAYFNDYVGGGDLLTYNLISQLDIKAA